MRKILFLSLLVVNASFLSSCASAPKKTIPPVSQPSASISRSNIHHIVGPAETLWRLSKMYDVSMSAILDANKLKDKDSLKMGQRLLIPGAAEVKPIINLVPNRKWRYIIIHHSATEEGNSLTFHKAHLDKGWDKGVGYHFIIDNGKGDKADGQIEMSPRWIKQQEGAHCKADNMNEKAIGICLVGNFDEDRVSEKQLEAIAYLVSELRHYYKIPLKNILGHGQVDGASTHCPGEKFPWQNFLRRLKNED